MVPIKKKSGPSDASAFWSVINDPKYSTGLRQIWVRTDKGKEFLNKHFQDMLRGGTFSFRCAGTSNWNVRLLNACIARFAIDSINILRIKIPTDISMSCQHLWRPTMTWFIRRRAGRPRESPIGTCLPYWREWRRPKGAFVSRKRRVGCATRAHQHREDSVR